MAEVSQRREHVFIRLDQIERYLAELARFHADAGRPAHVAGVRSAMAKIRREVARSDSLIACDNKKPEKANAERFDRFDKNDSAPYSIQATARSSVG